MTDTVKGALGTASDDTTFTYSRTFDCAADEGTHPNTATIVETDQSASASVTVNCYDLNVTKDADTAFQRDWTWTIDKSADQSSLLLTPGQSHPINYTIVVAPTSVDSDYTVSGDIWVENSAPIAAKLTGVADVVSVGFEATVDCNEAFPYTLAAGGTLHCTYSASLPNASSRTNTATATLQNYAYASDGSGTADGTSSFTGSANVTFSATPTEEIDECITLSDTFSGGPQGVMICAGNPPENFTKTYPRSVSYAVCGEYTVDNTASFVANDTGAPGSDSVSIPVSVPCAGGCTLTQGYWKTHSRYGPAPYDDTWALIGEDTVFYLSVKTYYQVLWTPPQGNAYYNLAHQYIAAKLNILNGASTTPAVDSALTGAQAFFTTKNPTNTLTKAQRTQLLAYAATLDSYNNGLIGPGHCSE